MFGFDPDDGITFDHILLQVTDGYTIRLAAILKDTMATRGDCDSSFVIIRQNDGCPALDAGLWVLP